MKDGHIYLVTVWVWIFGYGNSSVLCRPTTNSDCIDNLYGMMKLCSPKVITEHVDWAVLISNGNNEWVESSGKCSIFAVVTLKGGINFSNGNENGWNFETKT